MGAMGLVSSIGGLFGRETENPNAAFADPNNPFYKNATANYYKNLSKTMAANTPGKATLLASQAASGGDYGGSAYVAGKQNENQLAKNRDVAAQSSENFESNLFTEGMRLSSQGNLLKFQDQNSFSDNLMTLGGGLFSRFFNQADFGGGDSKVFVPPYRMR